MTGHGSEEDLMPRTHQNIMRRMFNGNLTLVITVVFTAGVLFAQQTFMAAAQKENAEAQRATANQVANLSLQMTEMKVILEANQRQSAENERRLVAVTEATADNTGDIIRLMERLAMRAEERRR